MVMTGQAHGNDTGSVPVALAEAGSDDPLVAIHGLQRSVRPRHGLDTGVSAACRFLLPDLCHESRSIIRVALVVALIVALVAPPTLAQAPPFQGVSPAVVSASSAATLLQSRSQLTLDQIAGCVDRGTLRLEIDLRPGLVPVADAWQVEVVGTPTAAVVATADAGHVSRLDLTIQGGTLLLRGKHLRPTILITSMHFEEGNGITEASFRGRGIWRPIVWVFRCLAKRSLRRLDLHTDIPSVLHGEVLVTKDATPPAASGGSRPSPPSAGSSFLDLVGEVRIHDSEVVAYGGRPLSLGTIVELHTASEPRHGTPVRLAIESGVFRPARVGQPARLDVVGRVHGEIEDGAIALLGTRCTFSHGELREGAFRLATGSGGTLEATLSAASLAVDLTAGEFSVPGGPRVDVEAPSRLTVRDLRLEPDGRYSGIVDAELLGKAGRIERGGVVVSLSDVRLWTDGAKVVDGRATGDVVLACDYHMDYPLVVSYPVTEVGERRVQLLFQGPFESTLHLQDAGSGGEGAVTGEYRFMVPWPPVEQAAFEVLRAAWIQDITPAMRDVDFVIEPSRFGPCGGSCFLIGVGVTVEKREVEGHLFRQICDAQGKADLVVVAASRSFVLRNVRVEPRCEGAVGWVVDVVGSLLAKTYSDITLFQMPEDLPFTIESVDSGADWLAVEGEVVWAQPAPDEPPGPSP